MRGRKPKQRVAPSVAAKFPSPLSRMSPEARREWVRIGKETGAANIVRLDLQQLAAYCENVALYWKAKKKLRTDGEIGVSPKGYPIQNPWLSIASKAEARMVKLAAELGLTPVSRTRLPAVEQSPAGGISEFLAAPLRIAK